MSASMPKTTGLFTRLLLISALGVLLFLAFLAGKAVSVPGLSVGKEVDIGSLASIFVALFMGIVVAVIFERRKDIDKTKKDIFIKKLDACIRAVEEVQNAVSSRSIHVSVAANHTKRVHSELKSIWNAMPGCGIATRTSLDALERLVRDATDLMTKTPIEGTEGAVPKEIEVVDSHIYYLGPRVGKINTCLDEIKDKLFHTQIDINRA